MFGLGIWELVVLLLIVLVVFGAKRLPEIGASLGEGIREFKESIGEIGDEERREIRPGEGGEGRPRQQARSEPPPERDSREEPGTRG